MPVLAPPYFFTAKALDLGLAVSIDQYASLNKRCSASSSRQLTQALLKASNILIDMLKERSAIFAADTKSGNYPLALMQKYQIRDSCLGNYWVLVPRWGLDFRKKCGCKKLKKNISEI